MTCTECSQPLEKRAGALTCSVACRSKRSRRIGDRKPPQPKPRSGRPRGRPRKYRGPLAGRAARLRQVYGITLAQYYVMLEDQGFCCASCADELDLGLGTHVDHCHATGTVRGVLCSACNPALGLLKDDPNRIARLLAYAERTAP